MPGMRSTLSWICVGLGIFGCAHVTKDPLTVAEHRNQAAVHREAGRDQRERYDPARTVRTLSPTLRTDLTGTPQTELRTYNPTEAHLVKADAEFAKANAHLVAAKRLLVFEDRACVGQSEGERSACPLFASSVHGVDLTRSGFVLTFKPGVDVPAVHRRLSCHLAYTAASGFDRPSCPLFVKGTSLELVEQRAIAFVGESSEVAAALHGQASRVFWGVDDEQSPAAGADLRGARANAPRRGASPHRRARPVGGGQQARSPSSKGTSCGTLRVWSCRAA